MIRDQGAKASACLALLKPDKKGVVPLKDVSAEYLLVL